MARVSIQIASPGFLHCLRDLEAKIRERRIVNRRLVEIVSLQGGIDYGRE